MLITRLLESNSFVRCIFIDFSKTFDTVCHEILLQKLVNFSCTQCVNTWLAQFLIDQTQFVGHSTSIQITRSIIQGSDIGPYAFLAMIADLKPSHPDICYSKYADELTAVMPAAISDLAGSEFGHIRDWSSANRLNINLSKTKEMVIFRPGRQSF